MPPTPPSVRSSYKIAPSGLPFGLIRPAALSCATVTASVSPVPSDRPVSVRVPFAPATLTDAPPLSAPIEIARLAGSWGYLDFSAIPRLERSRLPAGLRHDPNKYLFKIKWLLSGCQVGCALLPGARKAVPQPVQSLRLGDDRQPASRDTPGLVYLGGNFDEDKLDLYRSEMRKRIGWCFVPPQILYHLLAMMTHPRSPLPVQLGATRQAEAPDLASGGRSFSKSGAFSAVYISILLDAAACHPRTLPAHVIHPLARRTHGTRMPPLALRPRRPNRAQRE